ncbi:TRAP transporter substrate-binding protein [Halalkalibacterium ligniniphilum]|uniref:TRAP transporter substrate-binding protein n=1 Tax=Halalkalibacterium ligniniphilum TaxID=1134413 RepID=UPI0003461D0F|nr:TRAP transporter substrate-binding protein [Halalkalibacterium ligniniphilum]
MKVKKSLFWLGMLFILVLAACGGNDSSTEPANNEAQAVEAVESSGDVKTLRLSIGVNEGHPQEIAAQKFKELVEERSEDFKVEVYHSGQIADDRTATEMLQLGSLEITIPSTSPVVNFVPEYGVFDLPFTIPNAEVADKVLDGPFGDKMLGLLESQNIVGLAWWENGFRQLTNNERPVATLEDVKGLSVRTMENEIHIDAWAALGANPTPIAFTELFAALQQGTIDGQENPYPNIEMSRFYEVQNYMSNTNHVYTPFVFLMSKPVWEEMTEEQQTLIREAAVEAGQYNREVNRQGDQESLDKLKEELEFTEISPEEIQRFRDAVAPVIEKHADAIGREIVEEYLAEIENQS